MLSFSCAVFLFYPDPSYLSCVLFKTEKIYRKQDGTYGKRIMHEICQMIIVKLATENHNASSDLLIIVIH